MASTDVLVTGGAGFIGTALVRALLADGVQVRVLDSLLPQVHGTEPTIPAWMRDQCDVRIGDIRDVSVVARAVEGVEAVVHLAAETGTGQSMYAMCRHTDVNVTGTAALLEVLSRNRGSVRTLLVASSRAVYGEGQYGCAGCGTVHPAGRDEARLREGLWEPVCPRCGGDIASQPTSEDAPARPTSVYGVTKLAQEQLVMNFGRATNVGAVALRFQNVYGEGQSMSNPYTGILTHFVTAVAAGEAPQVFEDGQESRDFVHVDDVVRAMRQALALEPGAPLVLNVGSGARTTILQLAHEVCAAMESEISPVVVGQYRVGDVRHAIADVRRAAAVLGAPPAVSLSDGVQRFVKWAGQQNRRPVVANANAELAKAGLLRQARA